MADKLKTVRPALAANSYVKENGLNITNSEDKFLYSKVNKTERPKERDSGGGSSTHTSSSGRTHGGTGGKFQIQARSGIVLGSIKRLSRYFKRRIWSYVRGDQILLISYNL